MLNHISLFLIVFLGSLTQAMTGMGFGIIVMCLLPYFFPYTTCLISIKITSLCYLISFIFGGNHKDVKWKELLIPSITSFLGLWIANNLIINPDNELILKIILGIFITIIGIFSLLSKKQLHFQANIISGTITGIFTGFFGGACGVAGPPLVVYYLNLESLRNDKKGYYATIIMTFQVITIIQLIMLFLDKQISSEILSVSIEAIIPTVFGIIVGQRIYKTLSINYIKKLVYIFMVVMGLVTIINQFV